MLRLDMAHFSVLVDEPGFDSVVVIETVRSRMKPADRDQLLSRRLHITSFIRATRLQRGLVALPLPRQRKSCYRFWKHWPVEPRVRPRFAVVRRNFDARNPTATGPRQPGDFIGAMSIQDLFT